MTCIGDYTSCFLSMLDIRKGVRLEEKERKAEERRLNVKSGMDKLLTDRRKAEDPEHVESEPDKIIQPVVGNFSENDLIRNNIADPTQFDEPAPQGPLSDEIVVLSANANVANPGNVQSRWSFCNTNPLSNFYRSDPPLLKAV